MDGKLRNVKGPLQEVDKAIEDVMGTAEEIAVLFVDMVNSTAYKADKGLLLGVKKVTTHNEIVSKIITQKISKYKEEKKIAEAGICKYLGDGLMAYFWGDNSAQVAVEIALTIQQELKVWNEEKKLEGIEKYQSKISVDYGKVLPYQYTEGLPLDPHGLPVDRAARILSLAKPEQILVSGDVRKRCGIIPTIGTIWGELARRKLKGIKDDTEIYEVIWAEKLAIQVGIEDLLTPSIEADATTVYQFIKDNRLLEKSTQVDLLLYTCETLIYHLRSDLEKSNKEINFRVLIRNPFRDDNKKPNVIASLGTMSEIMRLNHRVSFHLRFYDEEPLLRSYIFHATDGCEGLLGIYRYDHSHPMKFVGAEGNQLLHVQKNNNLLGLFQSRFDYLFNKLTLPKAVIFDLDGVLIDSMQYYDRAWRAGFKVIDASLNIPQTEFYEREGEKRELTAEGVYKKYKGEEVAPQVRDIIIKEKEKEFARIFTVSPYPGVSDLLKCLKSKGIRLGLVTGSTQEKVDKLSPQDFPFDTVVCGRDTERGKPHPDPYLKAVERLDVPKENCYVVENAPLGISSAVTAGLSCFAVKNNSPLGNKVLENAGAKRVFKDISLLGNIFKWVDANLPLEKLTELHPNL